MHANREIYKLPYNLLDQYFTDDVEDEDAEVGQSQEQFSFADVPVQTPFHLWYFCYYSAVLCY